MTRCCGVAIVWLVLATACSQAPDATEGSVRLLFAGDVMVGRSVASVVENDRDDLLSGIEPVVAAADVAMANLESPLTQRSLNASHAYDLRGSERAAAIIAEAGFDVLDLANNHVGDAGPAGVADTVTAVRAAGMEPVGAGDRGQAYAPVIAEIGGLRVAVLAFDLSGLGLPAGVRTGVARWGEEAEAAVESAEAQADVVVVGLHGGAAYVDADPVLQAAGEAAVGLGAEVVWGHGAHVRLPIGTSGSALIATGLGNLLFDQTYPGTQTGMLLEVIADTDGVAAWRTGVADHSTGRVRFDGWDRPAGDAVLVDGEWWNLIRAGDVRPVPQATLASFSFGDLVAASTGDIDGDGAEEVVASFRRPFRPTLLNRTTPWRFQDRQGRSAHLGVFSEPDLRPIWIAGTLPRPVARLTVCDTGLAVAYDGLDDPTVIATGGWVWRQFGFRGDVDLPGDGRLGCTDVDGDGSTESAVVDRVVVPYPRSVACVQHLGEDVQELE